MELWSASSASVGAALKALKWAMINKGDEVTRSCLRTRAGGARRCVWARVQAD